MNILDTKTRRPYELENKLRLVDEYLKGDSEKLRYFGTVDIFKTGRHIDQAFITNKNIILTTYFISRRSHSEKFPYAPPDDISYISPWYNSINRLGLYGLVFHDGLGDNFVKEYTTDHVKFIRCKIGKYGLNDERFIIYYMFLLQNHTEINRVLMTDARDLHFEKDPFELLNQYDGRAIFLGRNHRNLFRHDKYFHGKIKVFERDAGLKVENNFYNQPIYNAGILGGNVPEAVFQLRQMTRFFLMCDSNNNSNMVVLNYSVYCYWFPKVSRGLRRFLGRLFHIKIYNFIVEHFINKYSEKLIRLFYKRKIFSDNKKKSFANTENIVTGFPLCSAFKKYEKHSGACIVHK